MQILDMKELDQVAGGRVIWSWKGAVMGGASGAAGCSVGGPGGAAVGLAVGFVGGGIFG